MSNTGYKAYTTLEQYYLDNGIATGVTKPNTFGDPDYIAPFIDLAFCPLPSLTPSFTPSVSISATPSITPTATPTVTPSVTPSISVTPTITPSISITPSVTPSISITPTVTPSISITPTPSLSGPSGGINVVYAYANMVSCVESCADYLEWSISLNAPVAVDTNYTLAVDLYYFGSYSNTIQVGGTILAGQSGDFSDPCLGGGTFIGCNYTVNSVCVYAIDSPVNKSTFTC
jgi:hypothetical protein